MAHQTESRKPRYYQPRPPRRGVHALLARVGLVSVVLAAFLLLGAPPSLAQSDTTPPVLVDFDFNPKSVDTSSGPVDVMVTAHITDDVAGTWFARIEFSGPQSAYCVATAHTGTLLDGTWSCLIQLGQGSQPGTWLASVRLEDYVHNGRSYSASELATLGFPTELVNGQAPTPTPTPTPTPPPAVGGVVEIQASGPGMTVDVGASSSDSSVPDYLALAGVGALVAGGLTTGAWYARRRWLS